MLDKESPYIRRGSPDKGERMKITAYDGYSVEFEKGTPFKVLLRILDREFFNNPKYKNYYGFGDGASALSEQRWLGAKAVGKDKYEHTKFFLDAIATLLLTHSEYDNKDKRKKYKELAKKKKLNETEKQLYSELKNYVFYNRFGHLLFINKAEEERCELKDLTKANRIKYIKSKIKILDQTVSDYTDELKNIKEKMQNSNIEVFEFLVGEYKDIQELLDNTVYKIGLLVDEYYDITELQISNGM